LFLGSRKGGAEGIHIRNIRRAGKTENDDQGEERRGRGDVRPPFVFFGYMQQVSSLSVFTEPNRVPLVLDYFVIFHVLLVYGRSVPVCLFYRYLHGTV